MGRKVGHLVSKTTREKISRTHKLKGIKPPSRKNAVITEEQIEKARLTRMIRGTPYMTPEIHKKIQEARKKHYDKIGRVSPLIKLIKRTSKYKKWRNEVFSKDKWCCQKCGIHCNTLQVHHKNKQFAVIIRENNIITVDDALNCKELWVIDNGQTLCRKCHKETDSYGVRINR
jgi:5-methylcytosine-specific restriction endonuclease McrA